MRIDEKYLTQEIARTNKPRSTVGSGVDFSDALAKAQKSEGSGTVSASSVSRVSEMLNVSPVGSILAVSAGSQSQAVKQLDKALDALNEYADAMADTTKSLKEMNPMIHELKQHAVSLNEVGKQLPEGPLRSMINETAVLATVEAAKFTRGDYV